MNSFLSLGNQFKEKHKQLRLGIELGSQIQFYTTITVLLIILSEDQFKNYPVSGGQVK